MTGEDLSGIIVEANGDYYWDRDQKGRLERFHTLSTIRMNNIKTLANAVDELATAIL